MKLMITLHDSMFVGHIRGQIRQCVLGGGDAPSPLLCPPHCVVNEFAPPPPRPPQVSRSHLIERST